MPVICICTSKFILAYNDYVNSNFVVSNICHRDEDRARIQAFRWTRLNSL